VAEAKLNVDSMHRNQKRVERERKDVQGSRSDLRDRTERKGGLHRGGRVEKRWWHPSKCQSLLENDEKGGLSERPTKASASRRGRGEATGRKKKEKPTRTSWGSKKTGGKREDTKVEEH